MVVAVAVVVAERATYVGVMTSDVASKREVEEEKGGEKEREEESSSLFLGSQ